MGDENNNPKPSTRPQMLYFSGKGYAIVGPDGRRVSGFYSDRDKAQERLAAMRAEDDARAKRGPRPCMCCGETFRSEGIHNRLCDSCRRREVAPDPLASGYRRGRERRTA